MIKKLVKIKTKNSKICRSRKIERWMETVERRRSGRINWCLLKLSSRTIKRAVRWSAISRMSGLRLGVSRRGRSWIKRRVNKKRSRASTMVPSRSKLTIQQRIKTFINISLRILTPIKMSRSMTQNHYQSRTKISKSKNRSPTTFLYQTNRSKRKTLSCLLCKNMIKKLMETHLQKVIPRTICQKSLTFKNWKISTIKSSFKKQKLTPPRSKMRTLKGSAGI